MPGATYVLNDGTDYGSRGQLQCNDPYDLRGRPEIICEVTGMWAISAYCGKCIFSNCTNAWYVIQNE